MNLNNIKLLVYDFDGVMTDNKVYVDQNGNEMVQVNRSDGLGIAEIKKLGIEQIIISTEQNPVVSARAHKIGIPCLQGIENKKMTLIDYCENNDIEIGNVAYVGNDINDKDVMETVGYSVATADAHHSIKSLAQMVLDTKGGQGVVRELADKLKGYRKY